MTRGYRSRLRRLEAMQEPSVPGCAACGWPRHEQSKVLVVREDEAVRRCQSCNRCLNAQGRPYASPLRIVRLHRQRRHAAA